MDQQTATRAAIGMMERGECPHGPNVAVVQLMGVRLVLAPMPRAVRGELNAAVRDGVLGHIRRDGYRPEAYHHKNGRANALEARDRHARATIEAIERAHAAMIVRPYEEDCAE